MATKTFEELKQLAIQIRDEKTNKQNTATRIGTQMLEHLDKLEQDYYDKTATDEELKERDEKLTELENKSPIYNVSTAFPLGSNEYYTFETARNAIPENERKLGMIITYRIDAYNWEVKQFLGSVLGFWDTDTMWKSIISETELTSKIKDNNNSLNETSINLIANKANGDLGKNLFNPKTCKRGYLNPGGAIQDSDGYFITNFIDVSSGVNLIANMSNPAGTFNIVYDKSGNVLRNFSGASYTYQTGDGYVRYSQQIANLSSFQIEIGIESTSYEPYTETYNLRNSVKELQDNKSDKTLYNLLDFESKGVIKGKYLNSGGKKSDFANSDISDYIKIPDDHIITHNLPKYAANIGYYGVYDEYKNLIRTILGGEQYQYQNGDYYIRLGYNHDQIGIGMAVNAAELPSQYIPYYSNYRDISQVIKEYNLNNISKEIEDLRLLNAIPNDNRFANFSFNAFNGAIKDKDKIGITIPKGQSGNSSFVSISIKNINYIDDWKNNIGKNVIFYAIFHVDGYTSDSEIKLPTTGGSTSISNLEKIWLVPLSVIKVKGTVVISENMSFFIQFGSLAANNNQRTIWLENIFYEIKKDAELAYPAYYNAKEIANEVHREIVYQQPITYTANSDPESDADFKGPTALKDAILAITDASKYKKYRILVTGTFEATTDADYNIHASSWNCYFAGKSYIDVIGTGNFRIICKRDNSQGKDVMPVDWSVNANLENLILESYIEGAYGIHIEGPGGDNNSEAGSNQYHIKTLKNVAIISYAIEKYVPCLGIGLYSGEIIRLINCRFFDGQGIYCHNNNYQVTAGLELINCEFNQMNAEPQQVIQAQNIVSSPRCQTYISCIGTKFNTNGHINYINDSKIVENYRLYIDHPALPVISQTEDSYPSFSDMGYFINNTGKEIQLGQAVTQISEIEIRLAKSTDNSIAGIAIENIPNGGKGKIIRKGKFYTSNANNTIYKCKEANAVERNWGDKLKISDTQDGYFELYSGEGNVVANITCKNVLELVE